VEEPLLVEEQCAISSV